ncbi:MAG: glycine cleavage system aminomethyltransferase GcvT [Desulfovibrionaceae bacterium]|nr:glycine cleavage system aminomethyltransferase GcvT [Desulfovibrionaceae bacterium]
MINLSTTPLNAWHRAHGAKMAPFAGWDMPIQYTGILHEHEHTRAKASVFDICHMGEFLIHGPGSTAALAEAISANLRTLAPGRCRYGFLLNEEGGILDDLITYRLADDSYMLVINAACVEQDWGVLRERLPQGIKLENISESTGKIDLQGPAALEVLQKLFPPDRFMDWRSLPYYAFAEIFLNGKKTIISRTGYTGELGYEIYLPAEETLRQWELCLEHPLIGPAGLGARDTLRLEAGLLLYGQDMDSMRTPAEAGYAEMLTSPDAYVGKAGAPRLRQRLTPLVLPGRRSARHGHKVLTHDGDGREIGLITSASFAPSLGYSIALAYIDQDQAAADKYLILTDRAPLEAERAVLPFYKTGTARNKLM